MDQIQSSKLVKETAFSTGDNNNGCGPIGMGSNTIINIFYPDTSKGAENGSEQCHMLPATSGNL
jgi:hypothetical protein